MKSKVQHRKTAIGEFNSVQLINYESLQTTIMALNPGRCYLLIRLLCERAVERYCTSEQLVLLKYKIHVSVQNECIETSLGKQERFLCVSFEKEDFQKVLQLLAHNPNTAFCVLCSTEILCKIITQLFDILKQEKGYLYKYLVGIKQKKSSVIYAVSGNDGISFFMHNF